MIGKKFIQSDQDLVVRVTFTLPDGIWADDIYLVGDFNDWDETAHPMQQDQLGHWTLTLELEAGRIYQFRYLCDGEWMNDNQADAYVNNPYGSHNFVVVTSRDFKKHSMRHGHPQS